MDSSSAQEMGSQTLESMLAQQEKKPRAADMQAIKCPRCDSTNTKFCYYNNYSLSQPRYFCKSCRRYWTKGGTLRNVPVGGGCRKNKRSSSSSKRAPDQPLAAIPTPIHSNDLSLAIARLQNPDDFSIWDGFGTTSGGFDPLTPAQSFYYGMGIPFQDFSSGGAPTASTAVTTVKQEMCGGREGESRVLWGFPWQTVGGDVTDFDSGRVNWNGMGVSNWQGLLNSPLM